MQNDDRSEEDEKSPIQYFIGDREVHGFEDEVVHKAVVNPRAVRELELYAEQPNTEAEEDGQERQEEVTDDKMAENPLMFKWLTVGGRSRAQCLHKYIDGYDIRLSPMFDSEVFNEFDIRGHKPWEQAVALGIERARGPISRIDVDPNRVIIIYRSRTNITSEVITWSEVA
jgi:hypothetical protein